MRKYTCSGSVRGDCGVLHKTVGAAYRHIRKDSNGCRRQGGYSDRRIMAVEGNRFESLTPSEYEEVLDLMTYL